MEEVYKQLAERNGWNYSLIGDRPYFMKNGTYAVPDETTSEEDKKLLAEIISEGSKEMAELILLCWNNGIIISGPCSGIKEFHKEQPFYVHFSFKGESDLIDPLYINLKGIFPNFDHSYSEYTGLIRYDISYYLKGEEISKEESDEIFSIIKKQLQMELENRQVKNANK